MHDSRMKHMPTGIPSFDPVLSGGVPLGSVILLSGGVGGGNVEFAYSSVLSHARTKKGGQQTSSESISFPEEIVYFTFTKLASSIRREIELSFRADSDIFDGTVRFIDLSSIYFNASVVPRKWYSNTDIVETLQSRRHEPQSLFGEISKQLGTIGAGSLIVFDSLTEMATQHKNETEWHQFISFLRGLQRVSKHWNTTYYLLISNKIFEPQKMAEIKDCCDASISFEWEETSGRRRQRVMFIEKFRIVMPTLEENDFVKFAIRITGDGGFEVSNIRMVL
jgi:KaiC/GvpD/RAD55 family RecA-like ATPase